MENHKLPIQLITKKSKIEHIYDNIDGWFDFDDIYKDMVNRFSDNSHFVEIGAAWGKSSSYMAVEIANSGKKIKFDVIDKWEDEQGSFFEKYLKNINSVKDFINPIKGYSMDVVNKYEDNSIDFLFIDSSHEYEDILNDIKLWYHKIKHNGIIAGHDYNIADFPGVVKAVNEYFGAENIKLSKWSWSYQKNTSKIPDHGRGGFLPAINYIKEHQIKNPIIVEIGTQREFNNTGDGSSTTFFSWFVNNYGGKLYSVDIENVYINKGKIELKNRGLLTNRINLINEDGINFFDNFSEKIDLLYLDAWDYVGNHDDKILSQINHLKCFLNAEKHLNENSLVLIDDVMNIDTYEGKGKMLIPHLLNNDYEIIHKEWQFLFKRKNNKIKHIYDNIDGWFDFEDVYKEMVNKFPDNSHFVEIGSWLGKSTSYMAVEIANSDKKIKFDAVDTWLGSDEHKEFLKTLNGSLYDKFIENVKPVLNYINPVIGYSTEVSKNYEDESLDFVFLDASHDYESVKNDIIAWYPKIKSNGIIAGHDYNDVGTEGCEWVGVVKAVNEFFGQDNIEVRKVHAGTWIYHKENKIESINYLSGGLLGDFIDQLSIIKENYLLTGKKGNLYLVDNNYPPDSFPMDWQYKPSYQLNWRYGIDDVYNDIKDLILKQDYILSFNIYKGEKLSSFIHLSAWRNSPLLYKSSFYDIYKSTYNIEWASHKWIDLPVNNDYKEFILISTSFRRFNYNYNFKNLKKYNRKILFITTDIREYNSFKELTDCDFDLKIFNNLIDFWIAINSCFLFVTNLSSFSFISNSTNTNAIYLLPESEDAIHFISDNLKWYIDDKKNNLNNKILLLSCCFNEEKILPFYLDYYTNFIEVDKIVIYDGGSNDNSHNIIREYSNVELIIDPKEKLDDRYLTDIRNNGWKKWRNEYDWIIVCDMDEFVYHPNLKEKLQDYDKADVTIPLTDGFDMIDKKYPRFEKGKYLPNIINRGVLDNVFLNKKSIFRSTIDINYHIGCHGCEPTGPVKYSDTIEIKHLHYKWIGHKFFTQKSASAADRLSEWNLSGGCGSHYKPFSLTTINEFYKRIDTQSVQVLGENNERIPLYAFSHNYLINDWKNILNNQLKLLKTCGLYDELTILFMYVYGDDKSYQEFLNSIQNYDDLMKIEIIRINENNFEYPTLQSLYDFVKQENCYVLYFHLKGVWSSYKGQASLDAVNSWRNCLEYFNIEKWKNCVQKLEEGYDVVGSLYNYNEKEPLFSGNFWWASSEYIKKLPRLEYVYENDPDKDGTDPDWTWKRVECEKWINKIPNKFYNFYIPKDYGFYYVPLKQEDYRKDSNKNYKISVLIPTYNRFNLLKESIQSVLNQNYDNFEILVCHDGPSDEYDKFKNENKHDKIFYFEVDRRNNYGAAQRNFMLSKVTGDYILHLDDDNIIYPNYFEKMIQQIDDQTGMVVCRIHYNDKEWYNYILPLDNKIQDCEIDQLGILFKSDVGKLFEWDDYFGHDHRYIKKCENKINERGLKIKYISDVLANHRYFGEIHPIITIIHHCYLRYRWKEILDEQIFLMKRTGLYDNCSEIYATIYADDKNNIQEFKDIISMEDNLNKWKIIELQENNYEFEALKFIKKYSENKHAYICYFHLKGVISKEIEPNIGVTTWRKYLNYFTINKWKDNINNLKNNDIVCVDWNFNDMHQKYVLGGHFFWTKSDYIRTLDEPINNENRFLSEIWITSNEKCKVYENFNYEKIGFKNLYLQWFNPLLYRKDIIDFVDELVEWSFKKHDTQQNKWEYKEFLKRIIQYGKTNNILEIGSKCCGTTYSFCNIFTNVVSIDICEDNKINELNREYNNLNLIIGDSHDIQTINKLKNSKFDVIYIDGNHHYDAVKKNYLIYKNFIKEDGIIIFRNIKMTLFNNNIKIEFPILWEEIKDEYDYEETINNDNDCYGVGLLFNKNKTIENKSVIIMTAHPNFKTSEEITKKSIESLKPLNTDIILSTHCPVSDDLQKTSNHFIYDKNNPLIRHDYYQQSWFDKKDYYALIKLNKNDNDLQHALAVYINYYNGILYAKGLGYNTAICTNFDIIFHKDDLDIINNKINEMRQLGKKSFFMTSNATEGIHYKTIFFITDIDFFIDNFKYVTNEKDYNSLTREVGSDTNCLENFFYQTLKDKKDNLLLQQINEGDLFSKSSVNLFSNIEYFTVLPLTNNDEMFVIWFSSSNSFDDKRKLTIEIFDDIDCIFVKNDEISNNYTFFKEIKFEKNHKYLIFCKIEYDDEIKEKRITIDNESFDKLKDNGEFRYK